MPRDFRNIKAWRHADDLAALVYSVTQAFPKHELYGLTLQLRRAAVSAPANIAEGAARTHKKEYLNFLYIARGSLAEVLYLLHLAHRLGYPGDTEYGDMEKAQAEAARTLYGLIDSVEQEAGGGTRHRI
jgi:four helix bundle protein